MTDLDSVRSFVESAPDRHGRIDVLVNNAGVMPLSALDALWVDEWKPLMRASGTGHIINIASTSAYRVDPTAAVYCATKYAVRALTEGLRQESRYVRALLTPVAPVARPWRAGVAVVGVAILVTSIVRPWSGIRRPDDAGAIGVRTYRVHVTPAPAGVADFRWGTGSG